MMDSLLTLSVRFLIVLTMVPGLINGFEQDDGERDISCGIVSDGPFPTFNTPLGQLLGTMQYSRDGKGIYIFHGIPYAKPPERFKMAEPVEPWNETLDARYKYSACPQTYGDSVIGTEDCLHLSVYTPSSDRLPTRNTEAGSNGFPVMVHIHGGSFLGGAGYSSFNPYYLSDEDVVLVSINYRLGVLAQDVIPGNMGLKDQVLALRWIKQYISCFYGDPNSITLFGWSAGGASVSHHIVSPMCKDLFHRAIVVSGNALTSWAVQENPKLYAVAFGEKVGCGSLSDSALLKNCLMTQPVSKFIMLQTSNDGTIVPFGPTIEPDWAEFPYQTVNPAQRLQNGDFNRCPLMTGFTQDEGILFGAGYIRVIPGYGENWSYYWKALAPRVFLYDQFNYTQIRMDEISQNIRSFYFDDKSISLENEWDFIDLYSDRFVVQSTFQAAELHSQFAPVYGYVMTYKGGVSIATVYGYNMPVISHGDDIKYFMKSTEMGTGTEQDLFSRKCVQHFATFAKTGKPAEPSLPEDDVWNSLSGNANSFWHQLNVIEATIENYLEDRYSFWNTLGLHEQEFWT